jgi:hypothetical protein
VVPTKIVNVVRGPKKQQFQLYCGKIGKLELGPNFYWWEGGEALLSCTFMLGRRMLKEVKPKVNIATKRWGVIL